MRSDFRPVRTQEAKKKLSKYLHEAQRTFQEEQEHYRELRKHRSVWQKLLRVFS